MAIRLCRESIISYYSPYYVGKDGDMGIEGQAGMDKEADGSNRLPAYLHPSNGYRPADIKDLH